MYKLLERTRRAACRVRFLSGLCLVAAVVAVNLGAVQAETFRSLDPAFSFSLPNGFQDFPQGHGPKVLYSFARGTPGDASFAVLRIEGLGGTIGREELNLASVEKSARCSVAGTGVQVNGLQYRKTRWKTFELDLIVTRLVGAEQELLTLGTQVPLVKEAVEISILGPAKDEQRLVAELQSILGSLDGRTNWLTDAERSESLGRLAGMAVGIVGAGVALLLWRRRRGSAVLKS
jgi:hypothetical protein